MAIGTFLNSRRWVISSLSWMLFRARRAKLLKERKTKTKKWTIVSSSCMMHWISSSKLKLASALPSNQKCNWKLSFRQIFSNTRLMQKLVWRLHERQATNLNNLSKVWWYKKEVCLRRLSRILVWLRKILKGMVVLRTPKRLSHWRYY